MKNDSRKIILAIIFVLVTTFSIYAGEGQCPVVPPPPPPTGNGLAVQNNIDPTDSTQSQTSSDDTVVISDVEDYLRDWLDFISRFSL